ncbi:MAG TPA: gluconokinase, GntK/IdnK-type [Burkholderiales bacterium]|nr:gluconokinase, GntK/IdnK-type [Burkholderiales bacterium]
MIVVVMGVSGVGKTTIGQLLARRLDCEFLDADDFHPPANVAKMAAGTPLEDADRGPWLERLNALLRERAARNASAVLACSALKHSYRERLCRDVACCRLVYLHADARVLRARLAARTHRYMPASLLDSQLAALEPPARAIAVDAAAPPEHCAEIIAAALTRP